MLTQPKQQCSFPSQSSRKSSAPSGHVDQIKFDEGKLRKPRSWDHFLKFAMMAPLAVLGLSGLSACASSEYMGISLKSGAAATDLQRLARLAQEGDKHAQLELGIRYEEGRGVPIDLGRAMELYALAASDSGGTIWLYSPPIGKAKKGQTIPVSTGPRKPGLKEAQKRISTLKAGFKQ